MNIVYYMIFIIILVVIVLLAGNILKKNNLNLFITVMCSIIIIALILNPENCINSSLQGTKLFVYKVFPTMFPFVILTNIIIDYGGMHIYAKAFGKTLCRILRLPHNSSIVIVISILCGYPLGAKYCSDLYEKKGIDFNTATRLLNIATNCSPLFIVGTIGSSMLHSKLYGYILLTSGYMSCLIMSILLPSEKVAKKELTLNNSNYTNNNFGETLKACVENSIYSCVMVAGFIIIFSVLLGQIKNTLVFSALNQNKIIGTIILGMVEMTNGCSLVNLSKIDILPKLILFSFFTSFGGLCVMSQVYAFTYKFKFNMFKYLCRKLLQGIISAFSTFALYILCSNYSIVTISHKYLVVTQSNSDLLILLIVLFVFPFILQKIKELIKSF